MYFPRTVYAIQHNETGRIYVGSTKNVASRFMAHLQLLKSGKHSNAAMQDDFDKYGEGYSLYILDTAFTKDQKHLEYDWMEKLKTYDPRIGYNGNDPHFKRTIPRIEVAIKEGVPIPNSV